MIRIPTKTNHPTRQCLPGHPLYKEGLRFPSASFSKEVACVSMTEDCFCSDYKPRQSPVTAFQPRHPLSKEGFRSPSASFGKEVACASMTEDCFCSFPDLKQSPAFTNPPLLPLLYNRPPISARLPINYRKFSLLP